MAGELVALVLGFGLASVALALARLAWMIAFWPEWKLRELAGISHGRRKP